MVFQNMLVRINYLKYTDVYIATKLAEKQPFFYFFITFFVHIFAKPLGGSFFITLTLS